MEQTEALIEALSEWNEETGEDKVNDFKTLILFILNRLGDDSYFDGQDIDSLDRLKNRVDYLMEDCEIHEDFLIMGIVNFITEMMENKIRKHGEFIIYQESIESEGISEQVDKMSQKKLSELKSPRYRIKAVNELDTWKLIKTKYFSESKRNSWENERLMETGEQLKEIFSKSE